MAKETIADLKKQVKDLEAANRRLAADHAQMALRMRESSHNGERWREQFWLLMKLVEAYMARNPDTTKGDPVAQAKMIASIDPQNKKWSIFWDSPKEGE